jgi:YesN/AraC family two-component response regulator
MHLKKFHKIQKDCVLKQAKVRNKCAKTKEFFGVCYAGMGEYIFAIEHNDTYLGFISVSGYCADKNFSHSKIKSMGEKYDIDKDKLITLFNASLKKKIPSLEQLKPLIAPLCAMVELLYLESISNRESKETQSDNIFNKLVLYLIENYNRNLKMDEISNALHYSKSYLSHLFFEKTKMTIMQYVAKLRISKAKDMLANFQFSVSDIAFEVGYNDANYFTNTFIKHTGMSPTRYRKMIRSNQ